MRVRLTGVPGLEKSTLTSAFRRTHQNVRNVRKGYFKAAPQASGGASTRLLLARHVHHQSTKSTMGIWKVIKGYQAGGDALILPRDKWAEGHFVISRARV